MPAGLRVMIHVLLVRGTGSETVVAQLSGQIEVEMVPSPSISAARLQAGKTSPDIILAPAPGWTAGPDPAYPVELIAWHQDLRNSGKFIPLLLYSGGKDGLFIADISGGMIGIGNEPSDPRSLITVLRQAANRSHLERSFRVEYDLLAQITREMPLGWIRSEAGRVAGINPAIENLCGYQSDDLRGTPVSDLLTPRSREEEGDGLMSLRTAGGLLIPVRIRRSVLTGPDMEVIFIEDRREALQLAAEVRETERSCREKLWLSETLVFKMNPDGIITFANGAMLRTFGYAGTGLTGHHISLLLPPGVGMEGSPVPLFLGVADESAPTSIHIMEHLHNDGGKIYVAWTAQAFFSPAGDLNGILCVGTDMTEQTAEGEGQISTRVWRDRVLENTDIIPAVFDAILQVCMEIAREGREGKPVGTAFLIGDRDAVMDRSRQLILNPFFGHPPEMRIVTRKDVREMLKEYALLDGAFVVSGDGMLEAAGRYITVDDTFASLPKGMGTRHSSTAAITRITRTIGIVVSESGGRVSVIREGKIVKVIG